MMSTLWHAYTNPPPGSTSPMHALAEKYHKLIWNNDFPENGREAYRHYNQSVDDTAQAAGREVLQYNVKEGWNPLCQLLGKEIPTIDFPRVDDWVEYKKRFTTT